MTTVQVGVVDVHVLRRTPALSHGWSVLAMRRSRQTRCTGAWEAVHGRIEPGELPADAAQREVFEETGLRLLRLYSVTVHPFYLHAPDAVQLAVVFAAIVDDGDPVLSPEHDDFAWLDPDAAAVRLAWPRERATLRDALALLDSGDAGPMEDVLRVR
jgi:8-oxo-dGTP pyrophosphatase MutT (NUDIX family)